MRELAWRAAGPHHVCHQRASPRTGGRCHFPGTRASSAGGGTAKLKNGLVLEFWSRPDVAFLSREVFEERAYTQHGVTVRPGDKVIDIGANIGMVRRVGARQF